MRWENPHYKKRRSEEEKPRKTNAEDEHPRKITAEKVSRSTVKENSVVDWQIVADGVHMS